MSEPSPAGTTGTLLACPECDLLIADTWMPPLATSTCPRCACRLRHRVPGGLERALAYTLTAAMLFALANAFPIIEIELRGQASAVTLAGMVAALYEQDRLPVAMLVTFTTMVSPILQITGLTWLLLPLRLGRRPPAVGRVFRLVSAVRPWNMIEVFVLGVLVAMVKLESMANVIVGTALAALVGVMLLQAAASTLVDRIDYWDAVARCR